MRSEWSSHKIGDLFELVNGYAFKSADFIASGVPVLKIKNVKPAKVVLDDLSFVSEEVASKRTDKEIRRGDILITMSGNRFDGSKETWVGKVAHFDLPGRYMLNQRVGVLRPKSGVEIDRKCAAYFLSSDDYQKLFISIATSSGGQANLSPAQILREQLLLPSPEEQVRISALLGALDERIALLRETNATLEAIAQALFKSWFVDFDPVHARARGKQPEGLTPEVAALFPDSFEESALGLVPKGWAIGELQDLLVLQRGFDLPASARTPGAYPLIAASGPNGTHNVAMAKGPGVITGRSGVLGKVFLTLEDYWPLNTTLWVKEFKHATPCYAYELLRMLDFSSFNAGSAVPTLNRNHIHSLKYLLPSKALVREFESKAMVLHQRALANAKQAETLTTLRDTLLPRLISGQLRLPDAEQQLKDLAV